jgi:hypothetical protein
MQPGGSRRSATRLFPAQVLGKARFGGVNDPVLFGLRSPVFAACSCLPGVLYRDQQ